MASVGIEFPFMPPYSPHFGGGSTASRKPPTFTARHIHIGSFLFDIVVYLQESAYIECIVCGQEFGRRSPRVFGEQPPGSMAWRRQPTTLPGHPPDSAAILVTYK